MKTVLGLLIVAFALHCQGQNTIKEPVILNNSFEILTIKCHEDLDQCSSRASLNSDKIDLIFWDTFHDSVEVYIENKLVFRDLISKRD